MLALAAAATLFGSVPDLPVLPEIKRPPTITYLDRTGATLGMRGGRIAPPVNIDRLPAYVPAAFVSIEDRRFYDHPGFDAVGIGRALMADLTEGRTAQGASTITQQLARNLFLSADQTVERKAREVLYAIQLERKYTKKQILGLYLSRVYFGNGAYGLEAASRRYYGKSAARLTVAEAAALAGVLKAPSDYNPADNPERSAARTRLVLQAMVETGAISEAQRAQALAKPAKALRADPTLAAQYFIDWLDPKVRATVGQPKGDVVVETTLDLGLETAADRAVSAAVARHKNQGVAQAAVVALDGQGRVRALVGGVDYAASGFNRAVMAHRQAGSAWKPFVYLTAMEGGATPDSVEVDQPVTIGGWSPRNHDNGFLGPVTLERAFAQSLNTVAAKVADEVGRDRVAATARRLGITTPISNAPAMALGSSEVVPVEMAQAYDAFANGGRRASAYGIERIRSAGGQVLWARKPAALPQAIANPPLSEMNRMLRAVVAGGTGIHARIPGYDIAGKTGTTTDSRDAWFIGFTGNLVAAVWTGRDDNKPMPGVAGGSVPAEIWRGFMVKALPVANVTAIPAGPPGPPPSLPQPALTPQPPMPSLSASAPSAQDPADASPDDPGPYRP